MTSTQIGGIVRGIMGTIGGFLVAYGIDEQSWLSITGAVVTLATIGWSIYSNTLVNQVTDIAASPSVTEVTVTDQAIAVAVDSPKVKSLDLADDL